MGRTCPHCGSSDIDDDQARGDSTCMSCGTVLEESTIVSDVTYQERSGGGSALVGQFVSRDRAQPNTLSGVPGLLHQESREVTYMKGKKLIEAIASQLRINQHCIDTAFNFFKMCVSRNFTRGRIRSHVVAACLYMTCRLENTAHLLLDFSDVTQVNVFDLGRTLNFLARSLKINLPTTDPCLYILRFAVLLEFGDKEKEVVSLATRLVERMKRDWISTGRRPTGLCGAALVLASRCYNFNRTINDIVRVVHISETVVRKRLDEFGRTPSSELTIDEFTTIDLEHCEDPPSFQESRRRVREQLKRKEEEVVKEIEPEVMPLEEELEKALERKRREKFKKTSYAKMMSDSLVKEAPELRVADSVVRNEIVELAFDAGDERQRPLTGMSSCYAPTLESLGISDPLKPQPSTTAFHQNDFDENANGELDLEGIDDSEIDTYILSTEEAEMKSRLWMKLNKDHLIEVERRQKERAEEEERDKESGVKRKRKKSSANVKKKEQIVAATAQEAMVKVIQEKKLSNKINYEILKEMEDSESDLSKEYYPTRDEVLSSLTGDDLKRTENGQEQSCAEPAKTECLSSEKQSDENGGTSSMRRRPLARSVRFRSALRSNRFRAGGNVRTANETIVKQENSLVEENELVHRTETVDESLVVAGEEEENFSDAIKIKKEDCSDSLAQKQVINELVTSNNSDKRSMTTTINGEEDRITEVGKRMRVNNRRTRKSIEKQEETVAAAAASSESEASGDIQMTDSDFHQRAVETSERSVEGSILTRKSSSLTSKHHFNEAGGSSGTSAKARYRAIGRTRPNLKVAAKSTVNNIVDDSNNGDDSQLDDESEQAVDATNSNNKASMNESAQKNVLSDASPSQSTSSVDDQKEERKIAATRTTTIKKPIDALQKRTATSGRLRKKALVAGTVEEQTRRAHSPNASSTRAECSSVIQDSTSETGRSRRVTERSVKKHANEDDMEIDTTNKEGEKSFMDDAGNATEEIASNSAQPSAIATVNKRNTRSRYVKMKPNLSGARSLKEDSRIQSNCSSSEMSQKVDTEVESSSSSKDTLAALPTTSSSTVSIGPSDDVLSSSCDTIDHLASSSKEYAAIKCDDHHNNQSTNNTSSSLTTVTDGIDLQLPPQVQKEYQRNFRLNKSHSSTQQSHSRNRGVPQKSDLINSSDSSTTTNNNDIPQTIPVKNTAGCNSRTVAKTKSQNTKSESRKRNAKGAALLSDGKDDDGKVNATEMYESLLLCASKRRTRSTAGLSSSANRRYGGDSVIGLEAMAALGRDCVAKPPNVHIVHGHFDATPSTSSDVDLDRPTTTADSHRSSDLNTASDLATAATTTTTITSESSGVLSSTTGNVHSLTISSEPSIVSCPSTTANSNRQSPIERGGVDSGSNSNTSQSDLLPSPSSLTEPAPLDSSETSPLSSTPNKATLRGRYLKLKPNITAQKRLQNLSAAASRSQSNRNKK